MSVPEDALIEALEAGDMRTAARLISRAESGDAALRPLLKALHARGGHARVVGLTGPPGAGKSTLADQLVSHWRRAGLRVAILAVDPSSPLSGGAVLGDRLRMGRHDADTGVFIRSMAARGMLGGLARATADALIVLDAMRWDIILLETVGVGQSEVDIRQHAACVVLLQTPVTGDTVQAAKAGVLEIADVLAVNKYDAEGGPRMVSALQEMLGRRPAHGQPGQWQPAVVPTVATTDTGVDALVRAIEARFDFLAAHPAVHRALRARQLQRLALAMAGETLAQRLRNRLGPGGADGGLLDEVLARREEPQALVAALLGADPA
ncbi:MAG: methylmalonyl Co-A mutase-associated GTPase MeaB [Pseudomonadota bacterium]